MDQIKIGRFIAERRKLCNMTQVQLAERLGVTDRAVSKWETGRAMPDTSIMLDLCHTLNISVNDLLLGEVTTVENHNEKNEKLLLEITKAKEDADRRLLAMECVIGGLSVFILLAAGILSAYLQVDTWIRIVIIVVGAVVCLIGCLFAMRLEQVAGYYECGNCGHRYVPTYKDAMLAMHMGRTRYLQCPECHKRTWNKKVISKEK